MTMVRREDRVRMVLGQVRDRYAYIVLDLAPSLSLVTLAALAAATDLVTPVNPERLAVNGLGTFLGWVDDFRREDVITAPLLGVLITKADLGADGQPRTRVGRELLEPSRPAASRCSRRSSRAGSASRTRWATAWWWGTGRGPGRIPGVRAVRGRGAHPDQAGGQPCPVSV
jgi:AAA domain